MKYLCLHTYPSADNGTPLTEVGSVYEITPLEGDNTFMSIKLAFKHYVLILPRQLSTYFIPLEDDKN